MDSLAPGLVHEIFFVVQKPKSELGRLIFEVSRSPIIRHTHTQARTHTHTISRTPLNQ